MAEIDIGVEDLVLNVPKVSGIVHIFKGDSLFQKRGDPVRNLVPGDIADLHAGKTLLRCLGPEGLHQPLNVHAPGVGQHADAFLIGLFPALFHQP